MNRKSKVLESMDGLLSLKLAKISMKAGAVYPIFNNEKYQISYNNFITVMAPFGTFLLFFNVAVYIALNFNADDLNVSI